MAAERAKKSEALKIVVNTGNIDLPSLLVLRQINRSLRVIVDTFLQQSAVSEKIIWRHIFRETESHDANADTAPSNEPQPPKQIQHAFHASLLKPSNGKVPSADQIFLNILMSNSSDKEKKLSFLAYQHELLNEVVFSIRCPEKMFIFAYVCMRYDIDMSDLVALSPEQALLFATLTTVDITRLDTTTLGNLIDNLDAVLSDPKYNKVRDVIKLSLTTTYNVLLRNFDNINTQGIYVNLNNAALQKADLSGKNLSGANLFRADLSQCNLSNTLFCFANFLETSLQAAILANADLRNSYNLRHAHFRSIYIAEEDRLIRTVLSGANLSGLVLLGIALRNITLIKTNFRNTILCGAQLQCSDFTEACFTDADLRNAKLDGADLTRATLRKTNLDGAHFLKTTIDRVDFKGSRVFLPALLFTQERFTSLDGVNFSALHLIHDESGIKTRHKLFGDLLVKENEPLLCGTRLIFAFRGRLFEGIKSETIIAFKNTAFAFLQKLLAEIKLSDEFKSLWDCVCVNDNIFVYAPRFSAGVKNIYTKVLELFVTAYRRLLRENSLSAEEKQKFIQSETRNNLFAELENHKGFFNALGTLCDETHAQERQTVHPPLLPKTLPTASQPVKQGLYSLKVLLL